jgi:GcrA cell cycle regulator
MMIGWTDERVESLKKLWAEGLSASQIAAQIGGVTRNAVIGKVHRLGLSGRTKAGSSAPRSVRPKVRTAGHVARPSVQALVFGANALKPGALAEVEAQPQRSLAPAIPFPAPPSESRIGILGLNEKTCRWPEGDPASSEFRFCGAAASMGQPYCPYHCAIAFQPSQDRRRDRRTAAR